MGTDTYLLTGDALCTSLLVSLTNTPVSPITQYMEQCDYTVGFGIFIIEGEWLPAATPHFPLVDAWLFPFIRYSVMSVYVGCLSCLPVRCLSFTNTYRTAVVSQYLVYEP